MHTTPRPATARLLAVCALLLGLFLMHGAPVAAGGCHDGMTAAVAAPGMASPHHAHTDAAVPVGGPSAVPAPTDTHSGAACLSTPAHGRLAPAAPPLMAVLSLAALAGAGAPGRATGVAERRRRGPPVAGRALLHQVCVSRT